jgi:hypothetical protein
MIHDRLAASRAAMPTRRARSARHDLRRRHSSGLLRRAGTVKGACRPGEPGPLDTICDAGTAPAFSDELAVSRALAPRRTRFARHDLRRRHSSGLLRRAGSTKGACRPGEPGPLDAICDAGTAPAFSDELAVPRALADQASQVRPTRSATQAQLRPSPTRDVCPRSLAVGPARPIDLLSPDWLHTRGSDYPAVKPLALVSDPPDAICGTGTAPPSPTSWQYQGRLPTRRARSARCDLRRRHSSGLLRRGTFTPGRQEVGPARPVDLLSSSWLHTSEADYPAVKPLALVPKAVNRSPPSRQAAGLGAGGGEVMGHGLAPWRLVPDLTNRLRPVGPRSCR